MINKYRDHLHVLPEDRANRDLVNGFLLDDRVDQRAIQVLPAARGWRHVLDSLESASCVRELQNYPKRHLLLIIDFDQQVAGRLEAFDALRLALPGDLKERVYLVGSLNEPEQLRAACGIKLEAIGQQLAVDCVAVGAAGLWQHAELLHNARELARLAAGVQPFLFLR